LIASLETALRESSRPAPAPARRTRARWPIAAGVAAVAAASALVLVVPQLARQPLELPAAAAFAEPPSPTPDAAIEPVLTEAVATPPPVVIDETPKRPPAKKKRRVRGAPDHEPATRSALEIDYVIPTKK
jgi:hypothetical protein